MHRRRNSNALPLGSRRGATLLELLVVILVLLMITITTVPVLSPTVQGRRIREGARMLNSFISAARNRALESGRPSGVWIDRMPGRPEAANTLHFAEIPPLYTGDFLDSGVQCYVMDLAGHKYYPHPQNTTPGDTWQASNVPEYHNIVEPQSASGIPDVWSYAITSTAAVKIDGQGGIHDFDQIQIEGSDYLYTLLTRTIGNTRRWTICHGINGDGTFTSTNGIITFTYDGKVDGNGQLVTRWYDNSPFIRGASPIARLQPLKYQVYRRPTRLSSGSIQLPLGIVIDLNYSSVTNGITTDVGKPFHPRNDSGNLYNGDVMQGVGNDPIIMMFSPAGNIEQLYMPITMTNTTVSSAVWQRYEPSGALYFLIGQSEYITDDSGLSFAQRLQPKIQLQKNWTRPENLWVRVDAKTGMVTSANIDPIANTSSNAYTLTQLNSMTTTTMNPNSLLNTTRSSAYGPLVVGGR
jgi:type II secretory pathway pseudopilin PulG